MTPYKQVTTIALIFSIFILSLSCKNEKPAVISASTDTVTAIRTDPKRLFFDSFPAPTGYVNDYEGLFTIAEKDTLAGMIAQFEKATTIQIAVVTFDSSMTTPLGLDSLTRKIANAWGIGQKGKNNGIVIGLSKQYRKMRIENGRGVAEILSDAETKQVIDEDFLPLFKQGRYYDGMKTGLLTLMKKLRQKYTA